MVSAIPLSLRTTASLAVRRTALCETRLLPLPSSKGVKASAKTGEPFPKQASLCTPTFRRESLLARSPLSSLRAPSFCRAMASSGSGQTASKKVLVPIGTGTEEMEAVILIDVLRRAGAEVVVASVEDSGLEIVASRKVKLVADVAVADCVDKAWDLVVLPGGMPGAERLRDSSVLQEITKKQANEGKLYGAICAAPAVALEAWGLLRDKQATAHPAFVDKLVSGSKDSSERVVVDGTVMTSQGPGTAFEFALALVEKLFGREKATAVAGPLVMLKGDGSDVMRLETGPVGPTGLGANPKALVPVSDGTEEMEAVILIDVMRRGGVDVTVASVEDGGRLRVTASRGVGLVADVAITECVDVAYDMIVLPGGLGGADKFRNSGVLMDLIQRQAGAGRLYGAMCASPALALESHGLLKGKKATAHPSMVDKLSEKDQSALEARVVVDGQLMTSQGPGTTMEFALCIVERLCGSARAAEVAKPMVLVPSLLMSVVA